MAATGESSIELAWVNIVPADFGKAASMGSCSGELKATKHLTRCISRGLEFTAMSGNKCHYFTCTDLSELRLPWDEDSQKGYEILGLEAAGEEWLKTLSLMDPNK